jgi:hypothetical protein
MPLASTNAVGAAADGSDRGRVHPGLYSRDRGAASPPTRRPVREVATNRTRWAFEVPVHGYRWSCIMRWRSAGLSNVDTWRARPWMITLHAERLSRSR